MVRLGTAIASLVSFTLVLSACSDPNRLSDARGLAPIGAPERGEFPDGLEIGHRLMANGEFELALKAYSRSMSEKGLNVDVLSALGSANLKLGRLNQARDLLEQAVERDQSFVPAWNNLGVVYTELQDYVQARQAFEAAFAFDNGQSEEVWQNLLLAIDSIENNKMDRAVPAEFDLVRRGNGRYLLLEAP